MLTGRSHSPNAPLWKLDTDINNDGAVDILLAFDHNRNGGAGLVWNTFLAQQDGRYIALSDGISFRLDATTVVQLEGDTQPHLIGYQPGGAGRGVLLKFTVQGDRISEEVVNNEFEPQGKDAAVYDRLFASENLVKTVDVSKQPIRSDALKPKDGANIDINETSSTTKPDSIQISEAEPFAGSAAPIPTAHPLPSPRCESSSPWLWLIGGFPFLAVMVGTWWKFLRK